MAAISNVGVAWQCSCKKWNNGFRTSCWKCGEPSGIKKEKKGAKKHG